MEVTGLGEIVGVALATGGTCSAVTVAAIKADVRNLRAWLNRVDKRATAAHDKALETGGRVSVLEAKIS